MLLVLAVRLFWRQRVIRTASDSLMLLPLGMKMASRGVRRRLTLMKFCWCHHMFSLGGAQERGAILRGLRLQLSAYVYTENMS